MMNRVRFLSAFALLLLGVFGSGIARSCEFRDEVLNSKILPGGPSGPKQVRYRVLLPKNFQPGLRYSVVYFLHGRGGDRFILDVVGFCGELDARVDRGEKGFLMVAPDGELSYWMNGALTGQRWGDVVTRELVAAVEAKYPVIASPEGRLLAGISMGGHGAIQLPLNYPGIYGALAAHSAVFRTQEEASRDFYYEFGTGEDYQNRDPFSLMMIKGKKLEVPIWLDMGGADPWLRNTRNFADYLRSIGAKADLHVGEDQIGGHAMGYWQYHLPAYMDWYSRHLR